MRLNVNAISSGLSPTAKRFFKAVARHTIGRLPPPTRRLSGKLAIDGGEPVRDVRLRPWENPHSDNLGPWLLRVRGRLRSIFLSGIEGLPQPLAKQFAQQWAEYCGCNYGLLLPHGTDALRLALAAVLDHDGLDYGGEVIVPNLSFIASATAALDRRFGVVFVDVESDTLLIDPKRVEEAIIPGKTRAIMAVHLFGQPANMRALLNIAKQHDLKIVEDAAQAHGSALDIGRSGSLGDAGGFSFQSSKNLACGEGGALTTNDQEVFERAYLMHEVGRSRAGGERWGHVTLGWNCRPTEYQAGLLLERFRGFERQQEIRQKNFFRLREMIKNIGCVEALAVHPGVRQHGVYMFVMRYNPDYCGGLLLPDFLKAMQGEGVPVNRAYASTMARQPAMQKLMAKRPDYFRLMPTPVAEHAAKEIIFIPHRVFLGTEREMSEIAAALRKVQNHYTHGAVRTREVRIRRGDEVQLAKTLDPTIHITEKTRPLRCGIIGMGIMGQAHAGVVAKHGFVSLHAVTDLNPQGRGLAGKMDCEWFDDPQQLIASGKVDAVIIATPHWHHAELSIASLRAGLHVICEKPLAVTVSQVDEVLREARKSKAIFAVVYQSRFEPAYQEAKRILEGGELGSLLRCSMVETTWRSEAFYSSSPWRGTWKGEGGGVLLNQAPHVLDRYAWLCGMPESVSGRCDASLHTIEVEDSASAIFRHAGAVHGHIHVSTNECPAVAQMVIACDRGRIVIEDGVLRVTKLRRSIREATGMDARYWGDIESETQEFGERLVGSITELLGLFYENIALAAAGKAKLVCPGAEGRNAVELANAIILSSNLRQEVSFPVNRADYDHLIATKIQPGASHDRQIGIRL
jgi:dTDP-4-amino-4,6-dideoxygalactose transaminase/predicted dehydrogenase